MNNTGMRLLSPLIPKIIQACRGPKRLRVGLFLVVVLNFTTVNCLAGDLFDLDLELSPPEVAAAAEESATALVADPAVTEVSRARPAVLLRLPLVRQGRDNTCGVACVQSILRYAGPEFDLREELVIGRVGTDDSGTPVDGMVNFLNQVRLREATTPEATALAATGGGEREIPVIRAEFKENLTQEDLIRCLDAGAPVICLLQAWDENAEGLFEIRHDYDRIWASGHYAIAIGYDERRIYFMDPSTMGTYTYIPRDELDPRWHGVGDITEEGIERLEHAGIVITVPNPRYAPDEFFKIL